METILVMSRLSIRHLIFIIVSIIAFPAISIIINSGLQQRRVVIRNAQEETQKLAEAIAIEQDNLVASTKQLFIALSQMPEIKVRKHIQVQAILAEILKQSPQYSNIFIADMSGVVWASAVPLKEIISVSDRRYFINALTSGNLSSGEYHIARTSGKPTFNLGYPLKDDSGNVNSVIVAGLSLEYYRHVFESYKLPKGASYVLLDHKGIILNRAVESAKYIGKPVNQEIFKHMVDGPEKETSIGPSGTVGDNRIQTYRKLHLEGESLPYMYIRTGIPVEIVMAEARIVHIKNLMLYVVSLAFAVFISWYISKKYIVDRVVLLERSSKQLAEGDYNTRINNETGGGELGNLGRTFDYMAGQISDYVSELSRKAEEYHAIIQTTSDGFNICDEYGNILEVNDSYCNMLGYLPAELKNMNIADIECTENKEMVVAHTKKIIRNGSDTFTSKHKHKSGAEIDVEVSITYLKDDGGRFFSFIRDITDRKKLETELLRIATYDNLTGIFNRKSIEENIQSGIERSNRYGTPFSLIMFDIDDFKRINDTMGHQVGDSVLVGVAEVVKQHLRVLDTLGRWGGEEFMIVLSDTHKNEAEIVAEKLRATLESHRNGDAVHVTASFGVTSYQENDTHDSLVNRVDSLLYNAKNKGKNCVA